MSENKYTDETSQKSAEEILAVLEKLPYISERGKASVDMIRQLAAVMPNLTVDQLRYCVAHYWITVVSPPPDKVSRRIMTNNDDVY